MAAVGVLDVSEALCAVQQLGSSLSGVAWMAVGPLVQAAMVMGWRPVHSLGACGNIVVAVAAKWMVVAVGADAGMFEQSSAYAGEKKAGALAVLAVAL